MPTPAINIHRTLWLPAYYTLVYPGGQAGPYADTSLYSDFHMEKPEGVSTTLYPYGYVDPTSWVRRRDRSFYGSVGIAHDLGGGYTWFYGGGCGIGKSLPAIGGLSYDLRRKAINGALAKLKNQSVNLSVAFGERKRTAGLVADSFTSIAKTVRNFRRGNGSLWEKIKKINPRKESYPNKWLEVQYGWKPLLNDVFGSLEALNKGETGESTPYYFTAKHSSMEGETDVTTDEFAYIGTRWAVVNRTRTEKAHASFVYTLGNPLIGSLASLGITNPLDVAWELAPYSFLIDWAVPVGEYLNLLDADFGWNYRSGSVSQSKRVVGRVAHLNLEGTQYYVYSGSPSSMNYDLYYMYRYVQATPPWPVFPPLQNPLKNETRVANAMSLLVNAFR